MPAHVRFGLADLRDLRGFALAFEFARSGAAFRDGDFTFRELAGFGKLRRTAVTCDFDFDARLSNVGRGQL